MSTPVVALCSWEDFNYGTRKPGEAFWLARPEAPCACRASLGARILTVWLPQGAVIRCRTSRLSDAPMRDSYSHHFGSHERLSRTRICIRITHLPTTQEPQA